jgi:integrase/recombinase XerD
MPATVDSWNELVKDYLRNRRRAGTLNNTSAQSYRSVLGRLGEGLEAAEVPLDAHSDQLFDAVSDWVERQGWSRTTRCTNLGIIRPFLEWGAACERIRGGVGFRLRNPRRPQPIPRALKGGQVETLLDVGVPDLRGRVIVLLEGQCALRRAEVAAIRWPMDVDLNDRKILVHGKGGTERMVYLSEETAAAIRAWLGERGTAPGALVCAYGSTRHLTPTWIGILVARWMEDSGLKTLPHDGVSGHALRHTAATRMLRDGNNLRVVQVAVGHVNLATTARYLKVDDPEVRAAMSGISYGSRRGGLRVIDGEAGA